MDEKTFTLADRRADEQQARQRIRRLTAGEMTDDSVTFYPLVPLSTESRIAEHLKQRRATLKGGFAS